jgi:uncharacterized membrane protein
MRKTFATILLCLALALPAYAQEAGEDLPLEVPEYQEPVHPDEIPPDEFYRAEVTQVVSQDETSNGSDTITTQVLRVRFTSGSLEDQEREISNDGIFTINGGQPLEVGDKILVFKTAASGQEEMYVADVYRVPSLLIVVGLFFLLAVALSRWKGVTSILGLVISVLVIAKLVVPRIIEGGNPLLVSLLGALIIALVSIYLAHGFNRRTTVALVSTLLTLGIAAVLAIVFVKLGALFGLGSEEAFYVQQLGSLENLNLQGLLLGGIILGALGVLDDITTAQTAAVYEIRRANATLPFRELYSRGLSVGREHINSLVNTLFLAYAGASLPLFLFFTVGGTTQPLWVTLNSEFIAEDVVRTIVGSMSLMLAVPITTFLAAYYFTHYRVPTDSDTAHIHHGHSH